MRTGILRVPIYIDRITIWVLLWSRPNRDALYRSKRHCQEKYHAYEMKMTLLFINELRLKRCLSPCNGQFIDPLGQLFDLSNPLRTSAVLKPIAKDLPLWHEPY